MMLPSQALAKLERAVARAYARLRADAAIAYHRRRLSSAKFDRRLLYEERETYAARLSLTQQAINHHSRRMAELDEFLNPKSRSESCPVQLIQ